jgi:hypothetical protein
MNELFSTQVKIIIKTINKLKFTFNIEFDISDHYL